MIEADLVLSKDRKLVAHHDASLNPDVARTPAGRYVNHPSPAVRDLTLSELLAFDVGRKRAGSPYAAAFPRSVPVDGEKIPPFSRMLEWWSQKPRLGLMIELKISPHTGPKELFASAFTEQVRDLLGRERIVVASFDWNVFSILRQLGTEIQTACVSTDIASFQQAVDVSCAWWLPEHSKLSAAQVKEARTAGLLVAPWTVNDPVRMQELRDWGVDGIITDYPDALTRLVRKNQ